MADTHIAFANIVATPTNSSWAQTYNAGRLFAVLSLTDANPQESSDETLRALGKDILDALEQEYFTLETKNLASIKQAVQASCEKVPDTTILCLTVASIVQDVLYVFTIGNGQVLLKRDGQLGTLFETTEEKERTVSTASGYVQNGDSILLLSKEFLTVITKTEVKEAIANATVSEIAETLTPKLHQSGNGAAAAIVLEYKLPTTGEKTEEEQETLEKDTTPEKQEEEKPLPPIATPPIKRIPSLRIPFSFLFAGITGRKALTRMVFLLITLALAGLLVFGVSKALKAQQAARNKTEAKTILQQAQKKYDLGNSLISLNPSLAHDNFLEAQKIVKDGKNKLPKDATEQKDLDAFSQKIDGSLSRSSDVTVVKPQLASKDASSLLTYEAKHDPNLYYAQDNNTIHILDNKSVSSVKKGADANKTIIKNQNDWTNPGGFGTYLGNMYILDSKLNQILKFVAAADGFGKTNYLSDTTVDLSDGSGLAIDGSIWVLKKNGQILKFTKGHQDSFTLSGIQNPLKNPRRIFTNSDSNNLYILDPENSRVVTTTKDGAYLVQYQSPALKDATDIDVIEKDKKLFFLSQKKVWQIDLK